MSQLLPKSIEDFIKESLQTEHSPFKDCEHLDEISAFMLDVIRQDGCEQVHLSFNRGDINCTHMEYLGTEDKGLIKVVDGFLVLDDDRTHRYLPVTEIHVIHKMGIMVIDSDNGNTSYNLIHVKDFRDRLKVNKTSPFSVTYMECDSSPLTGLFQAWFNSTKKETH